MDGEVRVGQSSLSVDAWRRRALDLSLIAVSGATVPVIALLLREAALEPPPVAGRYRL